MSLIDNDRLKDLYTKYNNLLAIISSIKNTLPALVSQVMSELISTGTFRMPHNQSTDLQGGKYTTLGGEYYHLTNAEYTALNSFINNASIGGLYATVLAKQDIANLLTGITYGTISDITYPSTRATYNFVTSKTDDLQSQISTVNATAIANTNAIALAQLTSNITSDITDNSTSTTKYPSVSGIYTYITTQLSNYQPAFTISTNGSGNPNYTNNVLTIPPYPTYTLSGLGGIGLTSLSVTTPLTYDNVGGVFSIPKSSTTQSGYLSSTDYAAFNSKQSALGYTPANKAGDTFTGNIAAPNLSGINTGNETATSIGAIVNAATKSTLLPADLLAIVDSAASNILSSVGYANFLAQITTATQIAVKSKCVPNTGADQTSVLAAELTAASAGNYAIELAAGVYNFKSWTTLTLGYVRLIGTDRNSTILIGPGTGGNAVDFVSTDSSVTSQIVIDGLQFAKWSHVATVYNGNCDNVSMTNCKLYQNRGYGVYAADACNGWTGYIDKYNFSNNDIENSQGCYVRCTLGSVIVLNNLGNNIGRDNTVWPYVIGSEFNVFGISIGDTNDVGTAIQAATTNIVCEGNILRNVYNPSVSTTTFTEVIIIMGYCVNVHNNIVINANSENITNSCGGFYFKANTGDIAGNIGIDCTTNTAAMNIKGKNSGAPLGQQLKVHDNWFFAINQAGAWAIQIYGSSTDVDVYENHGVGFSQGMVKVDGSPLRTHVRRNTAISCGGNQFYYSCGNINTCDITDNNVINQVMPVNTNVTAIGTMISAMKGQVNALTITNCGSGYVVAKGTDSYGNYWDTYSQNGSTSEPTLSAYGYGTVNIIDSATGTGASAFVSVVNGGIVAINIGLYGNKYVAATTSVQLALSSNGYGLISGSGAAVTVALSSGTMTDVHVSTKVNGLVNIADAAAYECVELAADSASSVNVDYIESKIEGTNTYIYGVHYNSTNATNTIYTIGHCGPIRMYGNNTNARQIPWRLYGSANLCQNSLIAAGYIFNNPALVTTVLRPPATLMYTWPDGNNVTLNISFSRFTNVSNSFLGNLPINNLGGSIIIKMVTCRVVFASGATSLTSSGSPTVGLGTASGTTDLIAATGIAAINSAAGSYLTTLVTGPSTEIVKTMAPSLYLNIAGANINSNNSVYLMIDIEYRVSY